jgi:hypothetical protein
VTLAKFVPATAPLGPVAALDDEDAKTVLTGWVGENLYSLNNLVITFSKLDAELGLRSEASALYLQDIVEQNGAKLLRRGKETILLASQFPAR